MNETQQQALARLADLIENSGDLADLMAPASKKHLDPQILRTRSAMLIQPPILSVVGSSRVGKTTLIQALLNGDASLNGIPVYEIGLKETPLHLLKEAGAIVWMLNATQILSMGERKIIESCLGSKYYEHVFFAVNFINRVDPTEQDEIKSYVYEGLKDYYPDETTLKSRVFFINAKAGLLARQSKDLTEYDVSGVGPLQDALCVKERRWVEAGPWRMAAETALYMAGQVLIALTAAKAQMPTSFKSTSQTEANEKLAAVERELKFLDSKIDRFKESGKERIDSSLITLTKQIEADFFTNDTMDQMVKEVSLGDLMSYAFASERRPQVEAKLGQNLQSFVRKRIAAWSHDTIQILSSDIEMLPPLRNDASSIQIPAPAIQISTGLLSKVKRDRIANETQWNILLGGRKNWLVRLAERLILGFLIIRIDQILLKIVSGGALVAVESGALVKERGRLVVEIVQAQREELLTSLRNSMDEIRNTLHESIDSYAEFYRSRVKAEQAEVLYQAHKVVEVLTSASDAQIELMHSRLAQSELLASSFKTELENAYREGYPESPELPSFEKISSLVRRREASL